MKPNSIYAWEVETEGGFILSQFNKDGQENSWKVVDPEAVIRISFVPRMSNFPVPRHDILIDRANGERFIRRFGRGFIKQSAGFELSEYINCCVTNNYRLYVFSSGRTLITRPDYEVYL